MWNKKKTAALHAVAERTRARNFDSAEVRGAVARMTDVELKVAILHVVGGLQHLAISAILGLHPGIARVYVERVQRGLLMDD